MDVIQVTLGKDLECRFRLIVSDFYPCSLSRASCIWMLIDLNHHHYHHGISALALHEVGREEKSSTCW